MKKNLMEHVYLLPMASSPCFPAFLNKNSDHLLPKLSKSLDRQKQVNSLSDSFSSKIEETYETRSELKLSSQEAS